MTTKQLTKITEPNYVGLYFHTYKDDKLCWQGKVLQQLPNDRYIVTTFDWVEGAPYLQLTVTANDMLGWSFYTSAEAMRDAYEIYNENRMRTERMSD